MVIKSIGQAPECICFRESQGDVDKAVDLAPNGGWLKHAVGQIGKIDKWR